MGFALRQPVAGSVDFTKADSLERRRGLRIKQARPVKVFDSGSARFFPGQTHDLSNTGLRLELPAYAPVNLGRQLAVHVGMSVAGSPLATRQSMVPARVVWVDRSPAMKNGRITVGIEFVSEATVGSDASAA